MDGRSIVLEKQNKTKQKKEAKNMNESMKAEIEKSAQFIDLSAEEAMDKFKEICSENGIEIDNPIAKGVWRNYVANTRRTNNADGGTKSEGNDSFYKSAFGFFVSLDAPRDMMA